MTDVFVFWEPQDAALCGLHALNTLLQEPLFHPNDLAEIAQELDAAEANIMLSASGKVTSDTLKYLGERSGNVDESGNFSIEVLRAAIKRTHDVNLISWTGEDGKQVVDVTKEQGFIINRSSHWFSIRRVNGRFWNLNSTLEGGWAHATRLHTFARGGPRDSTSPSCPSLYMCVIRATRRSQHSQAGRNSCRRFTSRHFSPA
jgi:ataxin-3